SAVCESHSPIERITPTRELIATVAKVPAEVVISHHHDVATGGDGGFTLRDSPAVTGIPGVDANVGAPQHGLVTGVTPGACRRSEGILPRRGAPAHSLLWEQRHGVGTHDATFTTPSGQFSVVLSRRWRIPLANQGTACSHCRVQGFRIGSRKTAKLTIHG